jgi:hypothetical protein
MTDAQAYEHPSFPKTPQRVVESGSAALANARTDHARQIINGNISRLRRFARAFHRHGSDPDNGRGAPR